MTAAITLNTISTSLVRQSFGVSGTLNVTPAFTYADDGGSFNALPGGSTAPATGPVAYNFLHPGFAVSGTHTVLVEENLTAVTVSGNASVSGTAPKKKAVALFFNWT